MYDDSPIGLFLLEKFYPLKEERREGREEEREGRGREPEGKGKDREGKGRKERIIPNI